MITQNAIAQTCRNTRGTASGNITAHNVQHIRRPASVRPAATTANIERKLNDHIAVDVFDAKGKLDGQHWIRQAKSLSIIDLTTRFCAVVRVPNMEPQHGWAAFRDHWVRWAGAPATCQCDPGGVFDSSRA